LLKHPKQVTHTILVTSAPAATAVAIANASNAGNSLLSSVNPKLFSRLSPMPVLPSVPVSIKTEPGEEHATSCLSLANTQFLSSAAAAAMAATAAAQAAANGKNAAAVAAAAAAAAAAGFATDLISSQPVSFAAAAGIMDNFRHANYLKGIQIGPGLLHLKSAFFTPINPFRKWRGLKKWCMQRASVSFLTFNLCYTRARDT
jgi:hypothetical protein